MTKRFMSYLMAGILVGGLSALVPQVANACGISMAAPVVDSAVLNSTGCTDLCAPAITTTTCTQAAPVIQTIDTGCNTCATPVAAPVVIQTAAPACGSPCGAVYRHRHFLRFGLGPILDFGLL